MSAQADTNCHDIFNVVSATRTHLAKIGATCHVVPTCHDMSATFPAKPPSGECLRRITPVATMVNESVENTLNTNKAQLLPSNYGTFDC